MHICSFYFPFIAKVISNTLWILYGDHEIHAACSKQLNNIHKIYWRWFHIARHSNSMGKKYSDFISVWNKCIFSVFGPKYDPWMRSTTKLLPFAQIQLRKTGFIFNFFDKSVYCLLANKPLQLSCQEKRMRFETLIIDNTIQSNYPRFNI